MVVVVEGGVLNHVKREGELSVHHENDVVSKSRYFSTVVIGWTLFTFALRMQIDAHVLH